MDGLTAERFGHGVPYGELHTKPSPLRVWTPESVDERRVVLCGTADLAVMEAGGDWTVTAALTRERKLATAIREWVA